MYENIPLEMREYAQWVVWRYEVRDPAKKPTKVPLNPHTGTLASVTDDSTWGTFEQAVAAEPNGNGIGFVLTKYDPYLFIDLDKPGDEDLHAQIYAAFPSYAERSPSGAGLHIIARGHVPRGKRDTAKGVEIYSEERYMTMTGNVVENRSVIVRADTAQLEALWAHLGGTQHASGDAPISGDMTAEDQTIIERARTAKNGALFCQLWAGQWYGAYPSQSEADLALGNILAFYTRNHEQFVRLFRASGLGQRDKAQRDEYIQWLINRAYDRAAPVADVSGIREKLQAVVDAAQARAAQAETARLEAIRNTVADRERRAAAEVAASAARHNAPQTAIEIAYSLGDRVAPGEPFAPPPGLVGDIAQFVYAQSPYPEMRTALVSALGFMGGLCGRAFNVSGAGCNVYLLYVAPTGMGKESISSGMSKLIASIKGRVESIQQVAGPAYYASGQALYATMTRQQSCVSIIGEFGLELQKLTHPRAPGPLIMLRKALLEIFGKSGQGSELGASAFADREKDMKTVKAPALSIIGESAPDHVYDHLSETLIGDGLLPRFVMIEAEQYSMSFNKRAFEVTPSDALVDALSDLALRCARLNQIDAAVNCVFDDEADKVQDAYRDATRAVTATATGDGTKQLWSRAHMKALKVAALVAVGTQEPAPQNAFTWQGQQDAHRGPVITAEIMRWAITLVNDGTRRLATKFESGAVGGGDSRAIADITTFLDKYLTSPASALSGAKFDPELHAKGMIRQAYLRERGGRTAAFRNGQGGDTATFYRVLRVLQDEGKLVDVSDGATVKVYAVYP